jgi:heme-degrading monooxygenase HmoA
MIRHIVMWKVRGAAGGERERNLAQVKAAFESLRGRVPGLMHLEIGIDESRIDYACDVVLVSEFASREALAAYAEHPEHLRVKRLLGDLRTERHQVDYLADPRVDDPVDRPAEQEEAGPGRPRTAARDSAPTPMR